MDSGTRARSRTFALWYRFPGSDAGTKPRGAMPQRSPIFGRGVPKTAIAPTTSSQNGSTPTPGIASRTSPGKISHCQPRTTNNSAAVTISIAHPIGGAKLVKAPMTSDTPATTKASASRNTENLRGIEPVVSVDRFSNSEGAEGSDIFNCRPPVCTLGS